MEGASSNWQGRRPYKPEKTGSKPAAPTLQTAGTDHRVNGDRPLRPTLGIRPK